MEDEIHARNAVVPFSGDQDAMPTQDRVGCEQSPDLVKSLSSENLALYREPTALIIIEQNPFLPDLLEEHLVFRSKILDNLLLLTIDPTCEDHEQELPGMEDEIHAWNASRKSFTIPPSLPMVNDHVGSTMDFDHHLNRNLEGGYDSAEFFDRAGKQDRRRKWTEPSATRQLACRWAAASTGKTLQTPLCVRAPDSGVCD